MDGGTSAKGGGVVPEGATLRTWQLPARPPSRTVSSGHTLIFIPGPVVNENGLQKNPVK
ncbi:hypothetical protein K190097F3_30880 [Enterocloster clostridioformis]